MNKFSIKEIEKTRIKFLNNARELLEEADLLSENKKFARAYSLAHLACEELAKIIMVSRVAYEVARGKNIDWKRVNRRLRNHKEKIKDILALDFLYSSKTENNEDVKNFYKDIKMTKYYNDFKNYSLYTSLIGDKFYKPSELFSHEFVKGFIKLAHNRFNAVEKFTLLSKDRLKKLFDSQEFKQLENFLYNYKVFFNENKKL